MFLPPTPTVTEAIPVIPKTSLSLGKPPTPSDPLNTQTRLSATPSPVDTTVALHERHLQIPGTLQGVPTLAVPDFGSSFDIISEQFVKDHFLTPDQDGPRDTYSLPDGRQRTFLGTITLPWSFAAESAVHHRIFHILRDSVHPVLFGRPFLKTTHTMSKNVERIKEVLIRPNDHAFAFKCVPSVDHRGTGTIAGATERILGLINGHPAPGFADTCSDISIIRRNVAHRLGLTILSGPEHTTEVQFVDGSTASTTGIIKNVNWCFGVSRRQTDTHTLDFHVMDDIPCAIILDKWLLWDNNAFNVYGDCFFDVADNSHPPSQTATNRAYPVCLIRRVKNRTGSPGAAAATVDPRDAEAARLAAAADEDAWRKEQAAAAAGVHLAVGTNNNINSISNSSSSRSNGVSVGSSSPTSSTSSPTNSTSSSTNSTSPPTNSASPPQPLSSSGPASQAQQPGSPSQQSPSPLTPPPAGSNNNSGTAHDPYWKRFLKRGRVKP